VSGSKKNRYEAGEKALQDNRNFVVPVTPYWNQTWCFGGYHLGKKSPKNCLRVSVLLNNLRIRFKSIPPPLFSAL